MSIYEVIFVINCLMLFFIIILNAIYVVKVKGKWRWIKLMYMLNGLVIAWITINRAVVQGVFTLSYAQDISHTIEITILTTTLFAGTVVSFSKLIESKDQIIINIGDYIEAQNGNN